MTPEAIAPSQLIHSLQWRYAVKAFDPSRKISAETWATIEKTLALAPSSFGLQPYRVLVVNNPATREKLMPHAWNQRQVVDASHFVVFAARTSVTEAEIDAFIRLIARSRGISPDSLAAYRGMMTGSLLSDGFKSMAPHWTARQAYIALGGLLTSAALLGVDACPMEGFVPAEFDQILDLPAQGLTAVVCCALGFRSPTDNYASLPKVRLAENELVKHL